MVQLVSTRPCPRKASSGRSFIQEDLSASPRPVRGVSIQPVPVIWKIVTISWDDDSGSRYSSRRLCTMFLIKPYRPGSFPPARRDNCPFVPNRFGPKEARACQDSCCCSSKIQATRIHGFMFCGIWLGKDTSTFSGSVP